MAPTNFTTEAGEDPFAFLTQGSVADFLLMRTSGVAYMCMLVYTFYHGCKLFKELQQDQPLPYKFVRMIFQCTGGGLLVPIFINAIPVSLGNDAYPICIFISTLLHSYFPVLREIVYLSPVTKALLVLMYENQRASVVCKLTAAAAAAIPATEFAFPLFGPIFCGGIAGCGGAFLPMDKGLKPLEGGLADNMFSALIGAAGYHLFLNTSLSDGVPDATYKAKAVVAVFFITYSMVKEVGLSKLFGMGAAKTPVKTVEPVPEKTSTKGKKKKA